MIENVSARCIKSPYQQETDCMVGVNLCSVGTASPLSHLVQYLVEHLKVLLSLLQIYRW